VRSIRARDTNIMLTLTNFSEHIIYILTFFIILAETGVVVCFFLPGDTLLFTLGLLSRSGNIVLFYSVMVVVLAAFLGNLLGYEIGNYLISKREASKFLKRIPDSHIKKTEEFYKKYGTWTVVLSRFVPVVRTVAPFLGGVAKMNRKGFIVLSLVGAVIWPAVIVLAGYLFGGYIKLYHVGLIGLSLMLFASIMTPVFLYLSRRYIK
jgi:membrane-associated protein